MSETANGTALMSDDTIHVATIDSASGIAQGGCGCGGGGGGAAAKPAEQKAAGCGTESRPSHAPKSSFVYAIGSVEARFPNLGIEKEFAQATKRLDTAGKTDQQTFHAVLSQRENRYLVRQMCWVMTIQGFDSYLLLPRDPSDLDLLVDAIRPATALDAIDVVIGARGPIAPPEVCNGLTVPFLVFDQIYSFDRETLIKAIPRPTEASAGSFDLAAEELFGRLMHMTDNAGATDEHRAVNYLVMRYPAIYAKAAESYGRDSALTGVEVRPAPLSTTRRVVDVIFSYTNRNTDFTERFAVRVDVTEEFPFLVTKLAPYYDRDIGGGR